MAVEREILALVRRSMTDQVGKWMAELESVEKRLDNYRDLSAQRDRLQALIAEAQKKVSEVDAQDEAAKGREVRNG